MGIFMIKQGSLDRKPPQFQYPGKDPRTISSDPPIGVGGRRAVSLPRYWNRVTFQ